MRILAIDPSSTCMGLYDGEFSKTFTGTGNRPERLYKLFDQLDHWLGARLRYDVVVYEEQFVRGRGATVALYGAVGIIEALSIGHFAAVIPAPQGTLRKWATNLVGKKDTPKELLRSAAYFKMGDESLIKNPPLPQTEHEWDAAAIYFYAKENVTRG